MAKKCIDLCILMIKIPNFLCCKLNRANCRSHRDWVWFGWTKQNIRCECNPFNLFSSSSLSSSSGSSFILIYFLFLCDGFVGEASSNDCKEEDVWEATDSRWRNSSETFSIWLCGRAIWFCPVACLHSYIASLGITHDRCL